MTRLDGVLSAHPFGDTGKITVLAKSDAALTEDAVKKAIEGRKFTLKGLEKKS